ncbi:hypothetical protein Tco_1102538 [Tanacetum coccineum]
MVVQKPIKIGEGSAIRPLDPHSHTQHYSNHQLRTPQKTQKPRKPKIKDTCVPQHSGPSDNVGDEVVHKELDAATTASSLEAEQDSGGGPRYHETHGDIYAQNEVLDLGKTKTFQHNEIASLKKMVKKVEKKDRPRNHKLKRLYKVGLTAKVESFGDKESLGEEHQTMGRIMLLMQMKDITLVSVQDDCQQRAV